MTIPEKPEVDLMMREGDEAKLAAELTQFAQSFELDSALNARLMQEFQKHKAVPQTLRIQRMIKGLATLAALVIFGAAAVMMVPPLRALAQEIIDFFIQATTDSSTVKLYAGGTPPPPVEQYPLSLEEVTELADFELQVPVFIPKLYAFDGAQYDSREQSVTLNYTCQGPWGVAVSQTRWPEEDVVHLRAGEVGASAEIEQVMIGTETGQYVRGNWIVEVVPEVQKQLDESDTRISLTTESVWTNNSEWQQLTWYADGRLYKVFTSSGYMERTANNYRACNLDKEDYVQLARSLQAISED